MHIIERSVDVSVAPEQAYAWLTDLGNLPRFQSGVFNSEVLTPPPTRVGSRFRETFRLFGIPMTAECEVIELQPPTIMGFSGVGARLDYQSRFRIEPAPNGSRITHRASVSMRGIWKLLGPLMKAEGSREIEAEHKRLKEAMEADHGVRPGRPGQLASAQSAAGRR